jgi:KUP system potassium uptake protein
VIALHIKFEEQPRVDPEQRRQVEELAEQFWHITLRYGFIEKPNLEEALKEIADLTDAIDVRRAVYFTTRDTIAQSPTSKIGKLRFALFAFLLRNSARVTDRFNLPHSRTMEVTRQVLI